MEEAAMIVRGAYSSGRLRRWAEYVEMCHAIGKMPPLLSTEPCFELEPDIYLEAQRFKNNEYKKRRRQAETTKAATIAPT
jgi:hypothetical protein